jgi:ABC-type sugar transport system ATPase subunit
MALGDRAAVMRAGRVVQCAAPTELYECPADLFVATFVGGPPMNVLRARLTGDPGDMVLDLGLDRIGIGAGDRWPGLHRRLGHDVAVGLRPETLSLASDRSGGQLRVEIIKVEHVGSHLFASATLEAHAVVDENGRIVVDPEPTTTIGVLLDDEVEVDLWRPVELTVDVSGLHVFDLTDGRRVETATNVQR